jgi:hypothetical protein
MGETRAAFSRTYVVGAGARTACDTPHRFSPVRRSPDDVSFSG